MKLFLFSILLITSANLRAQGWRLDESQHKPAGGALQSIKITENEKPQEEVFGLEKVVFGYCPFWANKDAYLGYDYSALTHLAYFSYEIDTATGGPVTLNGFESSLAVKAAKENQVKVILTATLFGKENTKAFLSSAQKRAMFAESVTNILINAGANGVNIDLEDVPGSQRENLITFFMELREKLDESEIELELTAATPAVDWTGAWDIEKLTGYLDYFMIMCYGYYWTGSSHAGPASPLYGGNYNIDKTIGYYLANGAPKEKLIMGLPWYGFTWPVASAEIHAPVTGKGSAKTYSYLENLSKETGKNFDEISKTAWFTRENGGITQSWFDDSLSLSHKYSYVNEKGLAGIGIWAISYAAGREEIWGGIRSAFGKKETAAGQSVELEFSISPNPSSGSVLVQFGKEHGACIYSLYSLSGHIAFRLTGYLNNGYGSINLPDISMGVYILQVSINGKHEKILLTIN